MAEAHQAVAFSFAVTHEGLHWNLDHDVVHLVWLSIVRSWKKRIARFLTNCKNGFYPSSSHFLAGITAIVLGLRLIWDYDPSFGLIDLMSHHLKNFVQDDDLRSTLSCIIFSIMAWLAKAMLLRYYLKLLLMYKGWMFESRSGSGLSTLSKLWALNVKFLTSKKPFLYSYQASLPRLPLPSLDSTIKNYLLSVKPLCRDEEHFREVEQKAMNFQRGIGRKLQFYLTLKSWFATNYVSDWWEEYVYLRGRAPLMVNSNYYGIDALLVCPTNRQTSRAANMIYSSIKFRRQIDRQELRPLMIQGLVPLCSSQYERIFNTTRIPLAKTDKIVHLNDSSHVVVYHKGRYYKLIFHHKGKLLQPRQIERLLEQIVNDPQPASSNEEYISSLTTLERDKWAEIRQKQLLSNPINRQSLRNIETAALVVVLEDDDFEFDKNDPSKLDRYGQLLLHGKGNDRWYDKSLNLIISRTGRIGFNAEHSFADAPILAHYWEFILSYDYIHLGYDEHGRCSVGPDECSSIKGLQRLNWHIDEELSKSLVAAQEHAVKLLTDVDLRLLMHDDYGKGFIKRLAVSPDAFIQMALQLAYYRDVHKLSLTYEASMTRLYREGRTETVRPVTIESSNWVYAMHNSAKTDEERLQLLKNACARHTSLIQNAMCGKGIDRHLFCLYVVGEYLEIENDFLAEVLSEPWKLSTSQTPHNQANMLDHKKFPNHISCGGGFGPVADDGYGVSYMIAGEDMLFFHVSSRRSSPETDSTRFANNIHQALCDMRDLFDRTRANMSKKN